MTGSALVKKRGGPAQTTDWWAIITELQRKGVSLARIGEALGGVQITAAMLSHYKAGTEPLHWRGESLLAFWCSAKDCRREDRPMRDVVRGLHRKAESQSQPAAAPPPDLAAVVLAPDPVKVRGKPGPKPGSRRKMAEAG